MDPRDLFRGDYVVLNYEISQLNLDSIKHDAIDNISESKSFYLLLQKAEKYWIPVEIMPAIAIPEQSLFNSEDSGSVLIRGKIISQYGNTIIAEYGIESYFVEEGAGKELEKAARNSQLDVEVSVDKFGNAVISKVSIDDKEEVNGEQDETSEET